MSVLLNQSVYVVLKNYRVRSGGISNRRYSLMEGTCNGIDDMMFTIRGKK